MLGKVTVVSIPFTVKCVRSGGMVISVEIAPVKVNVVCCSGILSSRIVPGYSQVVAKGPSQ